MRKIGYIYKYSIEEGKGLLFYKNSKSRTSELCIPFLFSEKDCLCKVSTESLVYFEINENIISNIEPASIKNFDRNLIYELVKYYNNDWDVGELYTHIKYQNLLELEEYIEYSEDKIKTLLEEAEKDPSKRVYLDDEEDDDYGSDYDDYDLCYIDDSNYDLCYIDDSNWGVPCGEYRKIEIPNDLEKEFEIFNNLSHYVKVSGRDHEVIIDLLDVNLWIPEHLDDLYYGKNVKEFNDLFNILFLSRWKAKERNLECKRQRQNIYGSSYNIIEYRSIYPHLFQNRCVPEVWKILLNNLSEKDLKEVLKINPILQPLLPLDFLLNNLDKLSIYFGFPTKDIAELYILKKINNIYSSSSYSSLRKELEEAKNNPLDPPKEEGFLINKFDINDLTNFLNLLEQRLTYVYNHVKNQILKHNNNILPSFFLQYYHNKAYDVILNIGICFDNIESFFSCNESSFYRYLSQISDSIKKVPNLLCQSLNFHMKKNLKNKIKDLLLNNIITPSELSLILFEYSYWIERSDVQEFEVELRNCFSKIEDIEELKIAYKEKFISSEIFNSVYAKIINDRHINICIKDIVNCCGFYLPDETQLLILKKYIKESNLRPSNYYNISNRDYFTFENNLIYSLNDFLAAVRTECEYGRISSTVLIEIHNEIIPTLTEKEKWNLFEYDLLYSPGENNISRKLSQIYKQNKFEGDFLEKECFQKQMAKDVLSVTNKNLMFSILNKLKPELHSKIYNKIKNIGKLYIWGLKPTPNIEKDILNNHFSELPESLQKRIYCYLFFLFSQKKLVEYNSDTFLEWIIEILTPKIKFESFNESKYNELELNIKFFINKEKSIPVSLYVITKCMQIVLNNYKNKDNLTYNDNLADICNLFGVHKWHLLNGLKEFFLSCNGWLLLDHKSWDKDLINLHGNVKKIHDKNIKKDFFKINFYDKELDYLHKEVEFSANKYLKEIEDILKINFEYIYIDGNYLISAEDLNLLKNFIRLYDIEDDCGLFKDIYNFGDRRYFLSTINCLPDYMNKTKIYKKRELFVCNCNQYGGEDPSIGIPFTWCKKLPCLRIFNFLVPQKNWEKYQFIDILNCVSGDIWGLKEIRTINSAISCFINKIAKCDNIDLIDLLKTKADPNEEIGVWAENFSISADSMAKMIEKDKY